MNSPTAYMLDPHGTSWRTCSTLPSVPLVARLGAQDAGIEDTGVADTGVGDTRALEAAVAGVAIPVITAVMLAVMKRASCRSLITPPAVRTVCRSRLDREFTFRKAAGGQECANPL